MSLEKTSLKLSINTSSRISRFLYHFLFVSCLRLFIAVGFLEVFMEYIIRNQRLQTDVGVFETKEAAEKALKTFLDHSHMFALKVFMADYIIIEQEK